VYDCIDADLRPFANDGEVEYPLENTWKLDVRFIARWHRAVISVFRRRAGFHVFQSQSLPDLRVRFASPIIFR